MNNYLRISEPLLYNDTKYNYYCMFPIKYTDVWELYKKQIDCFWRPEEIDLSKDITDWKKLNKDEQYFISMILAFFASSDGIVLENINVNFISDIPNSEVRAFYSFQSMIENIHSETYSLLIETYIKDDYIKNKLFNSIEKIPSISKKAKWCKKFMDDNLSFVNRLIAFACVEGIFFSGSFCSIFWLKKRGLMPGLTFSNELISRDEALHTDFALLLYSKINNRPDYQTIIEIVTEAVDLEIEFITEALPCDLIGMNKTLMIQYIKYVADRLIVSLVGEKFYNETNPFDFMELISLESKANFFESRNSSYALTDTNVDKNDLFGGIF